MARKLVRTCMVITLVAIVLGCVGCSNKAARTETTNSSVEETAPAGANSVAKEESDSSVHNKETVAAEEKSESSAETKDDSNSESSVPAEESSIPREESSVKTETSEQSETAVSSTTENSTSGKEETGRTEESSRKETQESSKNETQESEAHESTTTTAQGSTTTTSQESTTTTQESSATEEPKEESSTSVPTEQSESSEVSETSESSEESSGTTEAIDEVTQARMNLEAAQAAYDTAYAEYQRVSELLWPYHEACEETHQAVIDAYNDYADLPDDASEEEKAARKQAFDEAVAKNDEVAAIWRYQRDEVFHLLDYMDAWYAAEDNLKAAQAAYDEAVATYGTP